MKHLFAVAFLCEIILGIGSNIHLFNGLFNKICNSTRKNVLHTSFLNEIVQCKYYQITVA